MARLLFVTVLGACAGLAASACVSLAIGPNVARPAHGDVAASLAPTPVASLCRNIFDQSGSLCEPPPPIVVVGDEPPSGCPTGPRLVGTWVVAAHPERSLALFAGAPGPVPLGAEVGQQQLLAVGKAAALFAGSEGHTCETRLFGAEADHVVPVAATLTPTQPLEVSAPPVEVVGDEVRLSSAVVTELLAHPEAHLGRVRLTAGADGARVYGVRRGDLLHRAGLRSGDVIESVDGLPVTALDALVGVAGAALTTGRVTVRVRSCRGGAVERTLIFEPPARGRLL